MMRQLQNLGTPQNQQWFPRWMPLPENSTSTERREDGMKKKKKRTPKTLASRSHSHYRETDTGY